MRSAQSLVERVPGEALLVQGSISSPPGPASIALACGAIAEVRADRLTVSDGDGVVFAVTGLVQRPVYSPTRDHMAWTELASEPGATIVRGSWCSELRWRPPHLLVNDRDRPDRLAFSADGQHLTYVSAAAGIAAVWIVSFAAGQARQVSNLGLTRTPGRGRPPGFVAPPLSAPASFSGDRLTWSGPDGDSEVVWR